MRAILALSILFLSSCYYVNRTGPEPHSIPFNKLKFEEFVTILESEEDYVPKSGNQISEKTEKIVAHMQEVNVLKYDGAGDYHIFYCGFDNEENGWGFVRIELSDAEIERPETIFRGEKSLDFSFLKHLEGNWYRFEGKSNSDKPF